MPKNKKIFVILIWSLFASLEISAQIIINEKDKSDSSWMTKEIPAKKLSQKKFSLTRRLYQNLVTRFNYYYNAHTKLTKVLAQATRAHKDNYDSLLNFFPYVPADLKPMTGDLDSVILDAGIGIQIHDPRSKWIDNLYLLVGKAYYFKQDYPNAIASFKHIIKNKESKNEQGESELIGSRKYTSQPDLSVALPEEKKLFYNAPSYNDALIWLIRSYITSKQYDLAASLLNTLNSDPNLPERLTGDLAAMQAWYELSLHNNDKMLAALEKASNLQKNKTTKARWQYLLGQLYEQKSDWSQASIHYNEVTQLPAGPLMDFYAHLNVIRIRILKNQQSFAAGSKLLLGMARKEKYARYRSIIYYNLGKLALQSGLSDQAITYLQLSLANNANQEGEKLSTYQLLADTYYKQSRYHFAKQYYDSAATLAGSRPDKATYLNLRKTTLEDVVTNLDVISRQDSLLTLASMPPEKLNAFLNEIIEDSIKARKKRNRFLKTPSANNNQLLTQTSMDEDKKSSRGAKGNSWYFYNPTTRSKGFSEFKSRWGDRSLHDNWRLSNANQQMPQAMAGQQEIPVFSTDSALSTKEDNLPEMEKLMAAIPLSAEQKQKANDSIMEARYAISIIFYDKLEDDSAALRSLDTLLASFPNNPHLADVYYRLYLLYSRHNNKTAANHYRQLLQQNFSDSRFAQSLQQPAQQNIPSHAEELTTRLYDSAYIYYLSGEYQLALRTRDSAMKMAPHNKLKSRFDLLRAMTTIKMQSDSAGKVMLQQVIAENKNDTAIAEQAEAILEALSHKQTLVEHLSHLQLPQEAEETPAIPKTQAPVAASPISDAAKAGQVVTKTQPAPMQKAEDTLAQAPPPKKITPYKAEANTPYFVVLSFNHTDKKMIAKGLDRFSAYNQEKHAEHEIEVSSYLLAGNRVILIFRLFPNESDALTYYKEIRQEASKTIIPDIRPDDYRFFIISRPNFILLNSTQDYQGYLEFFSKNYR